MKKIFIFDAYPSNRELLSEELAADGNLVVATGRPEFVGDSVERLDPDLIILDLYAKGEMLWDLLLNLKSAYPQIPILIFTASSYAEDLRSHLADAWVRKSFLFEELKQNIRPLLRRSGKAGAPRENSLRSLSEPIAS